MPSGRPQEVLILERRSPAALRVGLSDICVVTCGGFLAQPVPEPESGWHSQLLAQGGSPLGWQPLPRRGAPAGHFCVGSQRMWLLQDDDEVDSYQQQSDLSGPHFGSSVPGLSPAQWRWSPCCSLRPGRQCQGFQSRGLKWLGAFPLKFPHAEPGSLGNLFSLPESSCDSPKLISWSWLHPWGRKSENSST